MSVAFVTEWGGAGWDQHSPTKQMQQGTQWKTPLKGNERELAGQMALQGFHSQTSHLVKPQKGAEILDPVLREQGLLLNAHQ